MRRFLLQLLAALALPTAVNANVDPAVHNLCKDVSDYMGCVQANKAIKKVKETKGTGDWECTLEVENRCIAYKNGCTINLIGTKGCKPPFNMAINENSQLSIDKCNRDPQRWWREYDNKCIRYRDTITYKGETFTASRRCSNEEKMRWAKKTFQKRPRELGCMTDKEHEGYWREYRMRQATKSNINIDNTPNYTPSSSFCTGSTYGNNFSVSCY